MGVVMGTNGNQFCGKIDEIIHSWHAVIAKRMRISHWQRQWFAYIAFVQ